MTILQAIILGAIQGITSLMPVSSSGHVMVAGHFLGADAALTLRMQSFLHIGTLIALLIILNRDVIRLVLAFAGIIQDLYFNGKTFIRNIGHSEQGNYRKVVCTNYRKLLLLLLTAMVPTIILASLLRGAAILASGNLLIAAMGFFVTALMLFVVSFMTRGDR
ncbi:MAG: undecaprenyl-diphosphate phosphatase, partial [Eubacterium sp.]|nr:undecaprenyl-diphosphate phosphatase [Eubacterium sp.]